MRGTQSRKSYSKKKGEARPLPPHSRDRGRGGGGAGGAPRSYGRGPVVLPRTVDIIQLYDMGFDTNVAIQALQATDGDLNQAALLLSDDTARGARGAARGSSGRGAGGATAAAATAGGGGGRAHPAPSAPPFPSDNRGGGGRSANDFLIKFRQAHWVGGGHGVPYTLPTGETITDNLRATGMKGNLHYSWYVFPQLLFGTSPDSQKYAINNIEEAQAFLRDPELGGHLREYTNAVLGLLNGGGYAKLQEILGDMDAMKFNSSMTLFLAAAKKNEMHRIPQPNSTPTNDRRLFAKTLRDIGGADKNTLHRLYPNRYGGGTRRRNRRKRKKTRRKNRLSRRRKTRRKRHRRRLK